MGRNSWDSFGPTIDEAAARANAAILARELRPHGYDVFTIDVQWYEPGANSYQYRSGAPLTMDEWGRLTPAVNRFPSAANGASFKLLADYAHALRPQVRRKAGWQQWTVFWRRISTPCLIRD